MDLMASSSRWGQTCWKATENKPTQKQLFLAERAIVVLVQQLEEVLEVLDLVVVYDIGDDEGEDGLHQLRVALELRTAYIVALHVLQVVLSVDGVHVPVDSEPSVVQHC